MLDVIAALVAEELDQLNRERDGRASEEVLLTPEEAAVFLRCKRPRIYDLIYKRGLPSFREGRHRLIRQADLNRLLITA